MYFFQMNPIFNVQRKKNLNFRLCFICQKRKKSGGKEIPLSTANEESILKLIDAAEQRKKLGENIDIFDRIETYLQNKSTIKIKWHKSRCYGPFTRDDNIQKLTVIKQKPNKSEIEETLNLESKGAVTRSKIPPFLEKKCAFCQIDRKEFLYTVSESETSDYIKNNSKLSLRLYIALSTVSDCPCAELKYHLSCYTRFKRLVDKSEKEERTVDYAMHYIIDELNNSASKGDVILLDDVWERYESYVIKYNTQSTGSYKDKRTFTRVLRDKLQDSYHFFNKMDDYEIILFPVNHLNGGIASVINQNDKEIEESIILKYKPENENEFLALVHLALRLRREIIEKPGSNGLSVTG